MLEDINVFYTIAKHQSFSKAARELDLSTPVVTRRLARLEKTLDARLLHRTTREVRLTEAGSVFYGELHDILQALEASKESVKSLTSTVTGTLKVGLPVSLSQIYVAPALDSFLKQYPKLQIQLSSGAEQLHLLNQGFDLVIHCGELPSSSFHYKKLSAMKKIMCASPGYFSRHGTPQILDDLSTHNCLNLHGDANRTWQLLEKGKLKTVITSGNVQASSGLELKAIALGGIGIAYLPRYLIHEELKSGQLISIFNEHEGVCHNVYAVYPTNKYLSKKAQLFLGFVSELLSDICA